MKISKCTRFVVIVGTVLGGANGAQGQTLEEKKATIAFLRGLQSADGGFLPAPASAGEVAAKPSLRATSAGLRALKYFGGEVPDKKSAGQFVAQCFDETTGGFRDHPAAKTKPEVSTTAVGLMAVVELKLPANAYMDTGVRYMSESARTFEEIRMAAAGLEAVGKHLPATERWLQEIAKMRNADGTFGKDDGVVRATGSAAAAILRLGGKLENRDKIVQNLKNGQRPDGGYGASRVEGTATSDLETSYRVIRSLKMLKEKPADVAKCKAFIARCRNKDGGYSVAPGQRSSVSATYFAGIILH